MLTLEMLFRYLGQLVVYGGGAVAIAYGLFKVLAVKWIDARFSERLEAFRHEQAKDLEQFRFRINSLFDRATKLNEKEYDVLPEAWGRLNEAYWKASVIVSPFQSYPDLERMTDAHLAEFLSACPLQDWEKQELISARERNKYYQEHIFWHSIADAKAASRESHVYLSKNGIFLKRDIKERFSVMDEFIWHALVARETLERVKPDKEPNTAVDRFRKEGEAMLKELEVVVQARMHE